jgi:chromosomal replication initiation ATPase DnaA
MSRLNELLASPPRNRMPCFLLFGATGMGKTHIVEHFTREHTPEFDDVLGVTRSRVTTVQMPPIPTERDFYEELLAKLGCIVPEHHRVTTLRQRGRELAQELDVRLLIIDEIHSLLSGTFREQRIFLNTLRFLANDLRLSLVCVGTHEAKRALLTDPQLADRFEAFELPPWIDDHAFHQLLASFGTVLPLRHASDLLQARFRTRLLSLTEGVMVRICRVLEAAAVRAIETARERIVVGDLSDDLLVETLVSVADRRDRRIAM